MKKIIKISDLKIIRQKYKKKEIGLVHGVFDYFHFGHLLHIEKAKSLCDVLIVSLTSDKFVQKGPDRPFYDINKRVRMLNSLSLVDYVVVSNHSSAVDIISLLKPNIYFKGNDYADLKKDYSNRITKEINILKKNKGKIFFTNEKSLSSSKILNDHSNLFDNNTKKYLYKLNKEITFQGLNKIFQKIEKQKILIIGDIIIDKYTFTKSLGKSPKEQLIPVKIESVETYGGGAIATANHIIDFVKECTLLSVVGKNNGENKKVKELINKKIKKNFIIDKNYSNIEKNRFIEQDSNTKLFQINNYDQLEISSYVENKILSYLKKNSKKFDQIIVHDFGHGVISKKIIKLIEKFYKKLSINVQTNSSNSGYNYITKYKKTNYFSIDEPEARLALQDKKSNSLNLFKQLSKKLRFNVGSITFGKNGTNIYKNKIIHFAPALSNQPVDTLGAGDAYFALSSLFSKETKNMKILAFIGNVAGALKIKFIGHRQSLLKKNFLGFLKTIIN